MAGEDLLYKSIFTLFLGFMIFVSSILNKIHMFLQVLDSYFVLFLFLGIIISSMGTSMIIAWSFKKRRPYVEEIPSRRAHFPSYLFSGTFLLLIGLTFRFFYKGLSRNMYIATMIVSIIGIALLVIGLIYYIKEVMATKKTSQHFGI